MVALPASNWDDIINHLRVNHAGLVRGWFVQLEPLALVGGILHIRARNLTQAKYLEDNCRLAFVEAAQVALGQLVSIMFDPHAYDEHGDAEGYPLSFEGNDQLWLNDDYTFDHFVVGPENRLAHAASIAVAESPGTTYNPLFIHGGVGLGKTHLLQATCQASRKMGMCAKIAYISCETFINHFIEAVERGAMKQFRFRYRNVDILVIDDIQFLGERERSQEEFFHTFNTLYQAQKQIILSADCSPAEIPALEQRLVSRFNSGLVASIDMPCQETRMAIIRKKARLRCIEVPEDVVCFVATRIESNIRDLEGALIRLDAFSQTRNGEIDLNLAHEALGVNNVKDWITLQQVANVVTSHFNVRLADLQGKKRTVSITKPRQIGMYLARELTKHSLAEIGGFFGGRDHTTVLHAIKTTQKLRGDDSQLNSTIETLGASLKKTRGNHSQK